MSRRRISLAFLAIFTLQMLGGLAVASVCLEACPDDAEAPGCAPICGLCTTCTHAPQAIVQTPATTRPFEISRRAFHAQQGGELSPLPVDIFHVPLPV